MAIFIWIIVIGAGVATTTVSALGIAFLALTGSAAREARETHEKKMKSL